MRTILHQFPRQRLKDFGIGVQPFGAINNNVTDLGVTWIRVGMRWIHAEAEQGVYDWERHDETIAACEALGTKVLGILSNGPAWACPGTNHNVYPEGYLQNYFDYVYAVACRYIGKVAAWEIWNEPHGNGWTTQQYINALLGASAIIRNVDHNTQVVGMVMNGTFVDANSPNHNAWVETVLNDPNVLPACDAVSFHVYCRPYAPDIGDQRGPVPERLDNSLALLSSLSWGGPVYATEGGWPTSGTTPGVVSEELQAQYIVQLAEMLYQRNILYFPFQLYGSVTSDEAGGMGFIRPDGTRKPSFDCYRDWIASK